MNFNDEIARLRAFRDFGLDRLLQTARDRGLPFHHERSARFHPRGLAATRALFSFDTADWSGSHSGSLDAILAAMRMPSVAADATRLFGGRSSQLHFGFEEQFGQLSCKLYLELPFETHAAPIGLVAFLGYKWNPLDHRVCDSHPYRVAAVGSYEACLRSWWRQVTGLGETGFWRRFDCEPLRSAGRHAAGDAAELETNDYIVLEVRDAASGRLSYDFKTYDRGIAVNDLADWLRPLAEGWGWEPDSFRLWLAAVGEDEVGHLAAGYGADKLPFLTVYHGARVIVPSPA